MVGLRVPPSTDLIERFSGGEGGTPEPLHGKGLTCEPVVQAFVF